jgi:hypothetical protein
MFVVFGDKINELLELSVELTTGITSASKVVRGDDAKRVWGNE